MKTIMTIFFVGLTPALRADHIPENQTDNIFDAYQFDAAKKRYADILKITDLIEEYIATTGAMPELDSTVPAGTAEYAVYEVAVLGQEEAVNAVFRNGTPFGFSLRKFRPQVLQTVLSEGLSRQVSLPIDPQRVGTHFAPVYFVFFRRPQDDAAARYIVMGTFAQPVARSTMVADGVHLLAISNVPEPFIIPVHDRDSFDAAFVAHIIATGDEADAVFTRNVPIALK